MPSAELPVDIAFDCLPLRSVGRLDAALDASDALRARIERLRAAMEEFGPERTYYLYNAYCIFRFANSEIAGACRFEFEAVVRTDAGDRKFQDAQLNVHLASETCGGIPPEVEKWLAERVRQAVGVEFDRFISAGQLADAESIDITASLSGFTGLNV